MKFSIISAAALLAASVSGADTKPTVPKCKSVITRPDVLEMPYNDWLKIRGVINAMNRDGWVAWLASIHQYYFNTIHGNSQFLPWHRVFVREYERVGQRYDPNFVIPYWDAMRDYRHPETSRVLTDAYIGGNGDSKGCVIGGAQAQWTLTFPEKHCLKRKYELGDHMNTWYSPEYINSIIQRRSSMAQFREDIEFSIHGSVHISLGGDMTTQPSPNDFAFLLHHSNIDRLWYQWQANGNTWVMDGIDRDGKSQMTLDSKLEFFEKPAREYVQLGYGDMCYQYASNPLSNDNGQRSLGRDMDVNGGYTTIAVSEDTNNADATTFSNTNVASDSAFTANLVNSLPADVLSKWFPKTAGNAVPANASNSGAASGGRSGVFREADSVGEAIPQPMVMSENWAKMHGYDQSAVNRVMEDAKNFVDVMNEYGYKSPY